jgi:hypothetical protein
MYLLIARIGRLSDEDITNWIEDFILRPDVQDLSPDFGQNNFQKCIVF